jgi:hypothetical protein
VNTPSSACGHALDAGTMLSHAAIIAAEKEPINFFTAFERRQLSIGRLHLVNTSD